VPRLLFVAGAVSDALLLFGAQVISARKGEFETGFDRGGQTREHAMLAKTAGVKHLGLPPPSSAASSLRSRFGPRAPFFLRMLLLMGLAVHQFAVVVINKMDDPTVNWAKERYDECHDRLLPFLKQTGFRKEGAGAWVAVPGDTQARADLAMLAVMAFALEMHFMPLSGFLGINLTEPAPAGLCDWYTYVFWVSVVGDKREFRKEGT
jgi:peptide chain release factor subunit 3